MLSRRLLEQANWKATTQWSGKQGQVTYLLLSLGSILLFSMLTSQRQNFDPAKHVTIHLSPTISTWGTRIDFNIRSLLKSGPRCVKEHFLFYLLFSTKGMLFFFLFLMLSVIAYGKTKIVLELYLHSSRFLMTNSSAFGTQLLLCQFHCHHTTL